MVVGCVLKCLVFVDQNLFVWLVAVFDYVLEAGSFVNFDKVVAVEF